jgi:hypothetical protein
MSRILVPKMSRHIFCNCSMRYMAKESMHKFLVLMVFLASSLVYADSDPCESNQYPVKWKSDLSKTKLTPILKFVFFVFFTNFQLVQNIIRVSHGNCKKASSKFG